MNGGGSKVFSYISNKFAYWKLGIKIFKIQTHQNLTRGTILSKILIIELFFTTAQIIWKTMGHDILHFC